MARAPEARAFGMPCVPVRQIHEGIKDPGTDRAKRLGRWQFFRFNAGSVPAGSARDESPLGWLADGNVGTELNYGHLTYSKYLALQYVPYCLIHSQPDNCSSRNDWKLHE